MSKLEISSKENLHKLIDILLDEEYNFSLSIVGSDIYNVDYVYCEDGEFEVIDV